ncbi:uncharacterized protein LOC102451837 [Pelodiscus sinensis]|uniref:uncharacterized protein LOC102451837 n=1 Tax=Pelodiscus sinensis TaxID=13735 RepID=UPI003F6CC518
MAWGLLLALCGGLLAAAVHGGYHRLVAMVTGVTYENGTYQYAMDIRLDGVRIGRYSSDTREVTPMLPWLGRALGSKYLQERTKEFQAHEQRLKEMIGWCMQQDSQRGGIHTGQVHIHCSLSDQAPVAPRFQFAYDGQDLISFDNQTGDVGGGRARGLTAEADLGEGIDVDSVRPVFHAGRLPADPAEPGAAETVGPTVAGAPRGLGVPAEMLPMAPSPSPAAPAASTRVPSTSPGCGTEATSWRRRAPAGSCPSPMAPTTPSRPWRSARGRTGPATPAGWSTAACLRPPSSGPLRRAPLPSGVLAAIVLAVLGLAGAAGAGVWLWRRKSAGSHKPNYTPAATKPGEDSASSSSSGTENSSAGSRS